MQTSEATADVFQALSKAQSEIIDAYKDQEGYGYKYANLASVLQIARPVLSKYGLCVIQDASIVEGAVSVLTRLCHQSGQWIECGPLSMAIEQKKGLSMAQCTGMVCTYARRYALTAAIGITQDDNDASIADNSPESKQRPDSTTRIADLTIEITDALQFGQHDKLRRSLGALPAADKGPVWSALTAPQHEQIIEIMKETK